MFGRQRCSCDTDILPIKMKHSWNNENKPTKHDLRRYNNKFQAHTQTHKRACQFSYLTLPCICKLYLATFANQQSYIDGPKHWPKSFGSDGERKEEKHNLRHWNWIRIHQVEGVSNNDEYCRVCYLVYTLTAWLSVWFVRNVSSQAIVSKVATTQRLKYELTFVFQTQITYHSNVEQCDCGEQHFTSLSVDLKRE